jgi:IS30 family transposase
VSGTSNGLIRQYLPKRKSRGRVSQRDCDRIARRLNDRPRKRLDYLTPSECYDSATSAYPALHFKLDPG